MKQAFFTFMMLIALVACTTKNKPATAVENQEESSEASQDTLKHLSPVAIWEMPNISREEYENNMNEIMATAVYVCTTDTTSGSVKEEDAAKYADVIKKLGLRR